MASNETSYNFPHRPRRPRAKAQARRAQVRKAQVEHRQRKTNYVKKLELDAANLRDAIADAEADVAALRRENVVMQGRLEALSLGRVPVDKPLPALPDTGTLGLGFSGSLPAGITSTALLGDAVSATLVVDEVMRKPCYRIVSDPHGSWATPPAHDFGALPLLSPAQEVQAINFILATFAGTISTSTTSPPTATTPSPNPPTPSSPQFFVVVLCVLVATPSKSVAGPALTLRNLHGLASSLPVDDKDLTPVQAWFELAGRYPAASFMLPEVVEALKREFVGVVKCFEFGATIERGAFDSVVGFDHDLTSLFA
ncbi:unnamed protein product [Parascedosporium putredinis]|uniref:BZIP domain-containing protein n=1 Tax=Parascedosporium putredinis TaxID=1442378 RepID=A0A9P1H1U5_9PEZI|nr:unnamed protein product [Parascedosporium putredinis]CAI7993420.1 unnamed protein product [Parascedosporium putredinis]